MPARKDKAWYIFKCLVEKNEQYYITFCSNEGRIITELGEVTELNPELFEFVPRYNNFITRILHYEDIISWGDERG